MTVKALTAPKLLVLDLDETLMHVRAEPLSRGPDFQIGPYFGYKRPHVEEFLRFCFSQFRVGVWSSASPLYVLDAVHYLMTPQQQRALEFTWASDKCQSKLDWDGNQFWCKPLKKLLRRGYRRAEIIAVDDSPEKWGMSYGNLVRVRAWEGDLDDDQLQRLLAFLSHLSAVPNVRTVEKRRWPQFAGRAELELAGGNCDNSHP